VYILPQDLPFGNAQPRLSWRAHAQTIRQAVKAKAKARLLRPNLEGSQARLTPAMQPRRLAACPKGLNAAVEAALSQPQPQACPPEGAGKEDWERILQDRRSEAAWQVDDLRRLEPAVRSGQIIASTDFSEVRRPEKRRFLELRAAYVRTVRAIPI